MVIRTMIILAGVSMTIPLLASIAFLTELIPLLNNTNELVHSVIDYGVSMLNAIKSGNETLNDLNIKAMEINNKLSYIRDRLIKLLNSLSQNISETKEYIEYLVKNGNTVLIMRRSFIHQLSVLDASKYNVIVLLGDEDFNTLCNLLKISDKANVLVISGDNVKVLR